MRRVIALIAGGILLGAHAARAQCPDGSPPPCRGARAAPTSIAVLYFDLLSSDSADAWLADGLTEQLIVRLGQVPRLDVKSRYEVQRFRGRRPADAAGLARTLGAGYVVTGSLRRSGTRVVVTAELLRAGTQVRRVWGDVFDRRSGDVLDIETAIATAVATAVAGQLQPGDRAMLARRPTRDPEAYLLYQHARALFNRGLVGFEERDLRAADAFYDAALERDSAFAAAWAGKAETWAWLSDAVVPGAMGYARVRRYATRALTLDSTSAVAHAYTVAPLIALDHDWAGAEAAARRAIAMDPRSPTGWMSLALISWCQGRLAVADSIMMRAWFADSMSSAVQLFMASALMVQRRFADMRAFADREDAAGLPDAAAIMRSVALSFTAPDSALLQDPGNIEALARAGRVDEAREALRRLRVRGDSLLRFGLRTYVSPDQMAVSSAAVGDIDQAFYWLGRAIDNNSGAETLWLKVDPRFDALRGDPRYLEALRRLNLQP